MNNLHGKRDLTVFPHWNAAENWLKCETKPIKPSRMQRANERTRQKKAQKAAKP